MQGIAPGFYQSHRRTWSVVACLLATLSVQPAAAWQFREVDAATKPAEALERSTGKGARPDHSAAQPDEPTSVSGKNIASGAESTTQASVLKADEVAGSANGAPQPAASANSPEPAVACEPTPAPLHQAPLPEPEPESVDRVKRTPGT